MLCTARGVKGGKRGFCFAAPEGEGVKGGLCFAAPGVVLCSTRGRGGARPWVDLMFGFRALCSPGNRGDTHTHKHALLHSKLMSGVSG